MAASLSITGAPTDSCLLASARRPARLVRASPLASIWALRAAGGIFPALQPADRDPATRYLRADCAARWHRHASEFPADRFAFLQNENGATCRTAKAQRRLSAIRKESVRLAVCADLSTVSPEFKPFLQLQTPYQRLCGNAALYRRPYSLLPACSAARHVVLLRRQICPAAGRLLPLPRAARLPADRQPHPVF